MSREEFYRFVSESTGNESNICQICAVKDGKIVYEDSWRGFKPEDPVNVNSVTKGVMALLTGIAVDKGAIGSIDEKVITFFPDYQVKRGEKTIYDVTVRHLLTMTAPYKGKSEPWKKVCTSDDWTKAALDFLGGRSGITGEFRYATLGIQILAGIIDQKFMSFIIFGYHQKSGCISIKTVNNSPSEFTVNIREIFTKFI